jgi:hypothetical protein
MYFRKNMLNVAKKIIAKLEGTKPPDTAQAPAQNTLAPEPAAAFGGSRHLLQRKGSRLRFEYRQDQLATKNSPRPKLQSKPRHTPRHILLNFKEVTPTTLGHVHAEQAANTNQANLGLFDADSKFLIVPIKQHSNPAQVDGHSDSDSVISESISTLSQDEVSALMEMNLGHGESSAHSQTNQTEHTELTSNHLEHTGYLSDSGSSSASDSSHTSIDSQELAAYALMGKPEVDPNAPIKPSQWEDRVTAPKPVVQQPYMNSTLSAFPPAVVGLRRSQGSEEVTALPAQYLADGQDH